MFVFHLPHDWKGDYKRGPWPKMRRETMADKKVNEATWALVTSFQETNQAIVQSIITAQERDMKFAQSFFTEGMDMLKSCQAAAEKIVAAQERNTSFTQRFFTEGMDVLKTKQGLENAQKATEQMVDAAQGATEQTLDAAQKAKKSPSS